MRPTASVRLSALLLALLGAAPAAAQPAGLAAAESLLVAGDSAGALEALERTVRADRRHARAWHRLGVIAWHMGRAGRRGDVMRPEDIRLVQMADTALRWATILAPDSARYLIDLALFHLNSQYATVRFAALGHFEKALAAARRLGDSVATADAADQVGLAYWRRYEAVADRAPLRPGAPRPSVDPTTQDQRDIESALDNLVVAPAEWTGQGEYFKAADSFAEALRHDPHNPRALRHVFMALAERQRWEELRRAALARTAASPWDPLAWLARGLASHRMNDAADATAAFDSAMVFLRPEDVARYTRLSRILRATDSTRLAAMPAAERRATEELYWVMADPLWLTPGNETRLEFLSRVTYAELLWTSEDYGLKGADTDRGEIHIRYGPPTQILNLGGDAYGVGEIIWRYENGPTFKFRAPPGFGTAQIHFDHRTYADRVREQAPALWNNIPVNRSLDSIRVQVARFRAGPDSADVFVAADIPVARLLRASDVVNGAVEVDFEVYNRRSERLLRDSSRVVVPAGSADSSALRAWRRRVDAGGLVYRVEALQAAAMRGARALGQVAVTDSGGFALSDVLVAERVLPRDEAAAARWSDFNIHPSVGRFRQGRTISLLWETYALAADSTGSSRYRVSITLDKVQSSTAARFAARIVGGVADAVGASARGRERATLRYDRTARAAPALVDYLTLDLGTAAPGRYTVSIEITDLVTNGRARRSTGIVIER